MTFIDEILLEAEKAEELRRIELDKLRADQLLMAVKVLEGQLADVNRLADDEIQIIEQYRTSEAERVQKKMRWLLWNLEQFMRSTDVKTLTLPHGVLKLRLGRDKVDVTDLNTFLNDPSNQQFLKLVPESYQPNLTTLHDYIKKTGHLPEGVNLIPAEVKFHYSTIKGDNGNGKAEPRTTEA
ncbi:MAG: host-nuclease inhibitor Gam family protein [Bacteroidota bacterium]